MGDTTGSCPQAGRLVQHCKFCFIPLVGNSLLSSSNMGATISGPNRAARCSPVYALNKKFYRLMFAP